MEMQSGCIYCDVCIYKFSNSFAYRFPFLVVFNIAKATICWTYSFSSPSRMKRLLRTGICHYFGLRAWSIYPGRHGPLFLLGGILLWLRLHSPFYDPDSLSTSSSISTSVSSYLDRLYNNGSYYSLTPSITSCYYLPLFVLCHFSLKQRRAWFLLFSDIQLMILCMCGVSYIVCTTECRVMTAKECLYNGGSCRPA